MGEIKLVPIVRANPRLNRSGTALTCGCRKIVNRDELRRTICRSDEILAGSGQHDCIGPFLSINIIAACPQRVADSERIVSHTTVENVIARAASNDVIVVRTNNVVIAATGLNCYSSGAVAECERIPVGGATPFFNRGSLTNVEGRLATNTKCADLDFASAELCLNLTARASEQNGVESFATADLSKPARGVVADDKGIVVLTSREVIATGAPVDRVITKTTDNEIISSKTIVGIVAT